MCVISVLYSVATSGYNKLQVVTIGYKWLQLAIDGHMWAYMATSGSPSLCFPVFLSFSLRILR